MRISDWSSDVCSSDLGAVLIVGFLIGEAVDKGRIAARIWLRHLSGAQRPLRRSFQKLARDFADALLHLRLAPLPCFAAQFVETRAFMVAAIAGQHVDIFDGHIQRSEEHTSELQSLMRISS